MRTQVRLYCPFHRDLSWMTQEVIEDYAGAKVAGGEAPSYCILKWTQDQPTRASMFPELLDNNPDFMTLQEELIDEFGIERFIGKPRDKIFHIRQLEQAIEKAKTASDKAALYKELREYQGWSSKPLEKLPEVTINNPSGPVVFENGKAIENERIVMSIFTAVNARSV